MHDIEVELYHKLYSACRGILRFNGVDKEKTDQYYDVMRLIITDLKNWYETGELEND